MMLIDPMIYFNKDDNEVWKPMIYDGISNGRYLISNFGNIYDLQEMKYIKHNLTSNGYEYVYLSNGVRELLHRLMAENFVAYKNEDQIQVNHINGIKTCNRDINLEWNTPKENTRHAFRTGLATNNIVENSHLSKLSNEQVEIICQLLSNGKEYNYILDYIGLEKTDNNRDMIGNIYRGIAWKHISSKYTFPEIDQRFRAISRNDVERICQAIQDGLTNKEVYEKVFGIELKNSRQDKNKYETIRLIRKRKMFTDISSKYNF